MYKFNEDGELIAVDILNSNPKERSTKTQEISYGLNEVSVRFWSLHGIKDKLHEKEVMVYFDREKCPTGVQAQTKTHFMK